MKHYRVAEARARFGDLLDAAERGDRVVIERRGVRFTLQPQPRGRSRRRAGRPIIEFVDAAVVDGQWTWSWRAGRLRYRRKRHST